MAIGERLKFFREKRKMTQKHLGLLMGFPEKNADVRIAQYEAGTRVPKEKLLESLAGALGVSTTALKVPDIENIIMVMHIFFTLEDRYGLTVGKKEGKVVMWFDPEKRLEEYPLDANPYLKDWYEVMEMYRSGKIDREEYDKWRFAYPEYILTSRWIKIKPSKEISDAIIEALKHKIEDM